MLITVVKQYILLFYCYDITLTLTTRQLREGRVYVGLTVPENSSALWWESMTAIAAVSLHIKCKHEAEKKKTKMLLSGSFAAHV